MDYSEHYVIWSTSHLEGCYSVDKIEGVETFKLFRQVSLKEEWAHLAQAIVVDGDPANPKFADCLLNTESELILSERLRDRLIELKADQDVEFLPVTLKTSSGTVFPLQYFIPHFLNRPDVIDLEGSEARLSRINKTRIDRLKRLHLKADPSRPFFKFANYNQIAVISMDLAEKLTEEGFSGIRWLPLFNHPNFDNTKKGSVIWKKVDDLYRTMWSKGKPISLTPTKNENLKKTASIPKQVNKWLEQLPKTAKVKTANTNEKIYPAFHAQEWLDGYTDDKANWPAFDPRRFVAFATNGQGNYWLFDLVKDARVVYYSHEVGYSLESNFLPVAASFNEFKTFVTAGKN